uniref:Alternative protein n=1 Tax=Echinococcus granulosus TaxID=6210 RepID=A0A068WMW4_ECHGR|nr:hypothetical protein EgrG_000430000 [Echinococcus granulosus]
MACVLQPSLGEQTSLSISRRPTHHPTSHSTVPPCPTLPCLDLPCHNSPHLTPPRQPPLHLRETATVCGCVRGRLQM